MQKLLLAAAVLGLSLSTASAECSYHKSVQASQPEKTVVASNETGQATTSKPAPTAEAAPVDDAAQPAE